MNKLKIAAGNWKMHLTLEEAKALVRQLMDCTVPGDTQVILAPPFVFLHEIVGMTASHPRIAVAGQNCHQEAQGAYTGEIAAGMLASIGVEYVILGHSERRMYSGEDSPLLFQKLQRALEAGLQPIFCCGEPLSERQAGTHESYVQDQLESCIFGLDPMMFSQCMIAYEPIWAIGTGETATPEQAQSMHKHIRGLVEKKYGSSIAEHVRILYGGSVKPANAGTLFALPDVDGGLVGGASLKADSFCSIIKA